VAVTALAAGRALLWLLKLGDAHLELSLPAVAPDRELRLGAGPHGGDDGGQLARALDRLAVDADDHVAGLNPRLGCGAFAIHRVHERAARPVEAEGFRELRIHLLDGDADTAAHDAARLNDLLLDVHGEIDRDRERDTH